MIGNIMKNSRKINKKQRRNIFTFRKIFIVNILVFSSFSFSSCSIDNYNNTYITKIIDGDTFEDDKKIRYRLLGVDTPESFDSSNNFKPTIGSQKFYATKATNLSSKTIQNKNVKIKKWKLDLYKRMVVRINYGTIELAKLLLSNGLARVKYISPIEGNYFYYPDTNYYEQLMEIQKYAKTNKIGIWKLSTYEQKIIFPK